MTTASEKSLLMHMSRMLSNRLDGRIPVDDVGDILHDYMIDYGRWHWCDIADEARRVWNLMFCDWVEKDSAMDAVWTAAAAQAADGAYAAVAAALGVDRFALREAVEPWLYAQDNPPPPISPQRLLEMCGHE